MNEPIKQIKPEPTANFPLRYSKDGIPIKTNIEPVTKKAIA